ncbi:hypothetical protein DEJ16_13845 [Curtobacterium sp. MCJR17_055]|uniref:hypothetical protein n=1 Tax=unclassified Curtobacterium TaxID=257496 RepID=UPI000D914D3A|nr:MULTISPECIES: hypothetical protein [unclassified Curtobacterium]PYY33275.1 hypothetical protein DEI87_12305 [Curtobacterium sp. MCBD17_029]PYY53218.1 hypothetical protein DEJ16_13845 [Curtobacterium sp. MCJR17_055]PYY56373.1 hypothetical protein DEJ26_13085 [Curtobacterium sp. MCPF17_015]
MKPDRRKAVIVLRATGAALFTVVVLTGCSAGLGKSPEQAEQSIVTFVEGSADVVGYDWEVRDGPGLGVTTERYQTGGVDPTLGVRGRGGPVSSSGFRADPRGYTIDGSSQCIAGDFDKMSRDNPG